MAWSIDGRNVLVTGGNSGIGLAVASELAKRGALVTIAARSPEKGKRAEARIKDETGKKVGVLHMDLADLDSVARAAETYADRHSSLHVLVNNAGGFFGKRAMTTNGFERTIGTNYVGPFMFTKLLTPLLESSAPSRVINVASSAHGSAESGIDITDLNSAHGYKMMDAYGQSKLANILHAREFDRRHGANGVRAFAMHPGMVRTSIGRDGDSRLVAIGMRLTAWKWRTPEQGADTIVWLATTDPHPQPVGGYFEDRSEARSTAHARDDNMARELWVATESLIDASMGVGG